MANISQDEVTARLRRHKGTDLNDRAIFSNTDFTGLSFSNLQLTGAQFPLNSDFTNCIFDKSQMRGTFFVGSNANNGTKFNNTVWNRVNAYSTNYAKVAQVFLGCDFYTASFTECDMSNSLFISCIFDNCTMKDCNFSNCTFLDCQFSSHGYQKIYRSNFYNCIFKSTNALVATSTSYVPNSTFWNCNFEGANFLDLYTAGNGTTDTGMGFYYCNLRRTTFKFRQQFPNPPAQPTTDIFTFEVCSIGNAVIPWQNKLPTVHIRINVDFFNDTEHSIEFDRNVVP